MEWSKCLAPDFGEGRRFLRLGTLRQGPEAFSPRPRFAPALCGILRPGDALLCGGVEGIVHVVEQAFPVQLGQRFHFNFFAGENFLAEGVEFFRRIKGKEFQEVRVPQNPLPEAADEEAVPQFVVILEQRHGRREAEIMAESFEQPDAIAVDRAEESLLKGALDSRGDRRGPDRHTRALLHLLGCADRIGDDDEARETVDGFRFGQACEMDDAIDDRGRLADARRGDDGDVLFLLEDEAVALDLIDQRAHSSSFPGATPWTSAHFASRMSGGTNRVAIGCEGE